MQEQKLIAQRTLWIIFLTTMLSFVGVTLLTPKFIDWYASPFMPQGVSCAPSIQWALNKMLWLQLFSVVGGFLLGAIFAFKFRKKSTPSA